jgi:hypothetical protein
VANHSIELAHDWSQSDVDIMGSQDVDIMGSQDLGLSSIQKPHVKFDVGILAHVEVYRMRVQTEMGTGCTFYRPLRLLMSETSANSYLKVRAVTQVRVAFWMKEFSSRGFLGSQALCAKERLLSSGAKELWIFVHAHTRTHT